MTPVAPRDARPGQSRVRAAAKAVFAAVPPLGRAARELRWRLGRGPAPVLDRPGERRTRGAALRAYRRFPLDVLVTFALNARSRDARDLVAAVASGRRGAGYDQLIASLSGATTPRYARDAVSALATLVADQLLDPADTVEVIALYRYLDRHAELSDAERLAWTNALIADGRMDDAAHQFSLVTEDSLEVDNTLADLGNPFRADPGAAAPDEWLATFNRVFTRFGAEPARLGGASVGDTPFDRLSGPRLPRVDGPIISVVMTAWHPGGEIFSAVRSILDQTWHRLELIVVDDGSPSGYDAVFAKVAALDERVRVIRNSDNLGTYARRNQAILAARGHFVTMHDSDDWAHPRRLELQARWLLANPSTPASISLCVRATPLLQFHQSRGTGLRECQPSLMFEREKTIAGVGFFDTVRKNADTEFARRLTAASALPVHIHTELPPLTVQRMESKSLSGSEILPRWLHEARTIYGANYNAWHARILAGQASPVLTPADPRPFAAPAHLSGIPAEPRELDVVFVVDLVRRSGELRHFAPLAGHLRTLAESGLSVGIVHAWSVGLFQEAQAQYPAELQELQVAGLVRVLVSDEPAHARIGIVPDVSVLQFRGARTTRIRFDRLIGLTEPGDAPHHPGGGAWWRGDVEATAQYLYESAIDWLTPEKAWQAIPGPR